MDHRAFRLLAAGAALEDLDREERREFDGHIRSCRSCAGLTLSLEDTLADLALAAPQLAPPSALRAVMLETLPRPPHGRRSGPLGRPSWTLAAAAVVALLVVGLGARAWSLDSALAEVEARSDAQAAAMAVIVDPRHRTADLSAEPVAPIADATVIYRPGTADAFILADHLPPTPAGMVYQLWYADETGVHPLGTYAYDGDGPFLASFGVDLDGSVAAMVTLEPVGGSVGEPGPQVVFGEL
jgi:Anti-sigma-K factor rskA, C-terminal